MPAGIFIYENEWTTALFCVKCASENPSNTHGHTREMFSTEINQRYAGINIKVSEERPVYCDWCGTPIWGRNPLTMA